MTATMNVEEGNGSGPTWTVITSGRYCTRDSYNPGDNDPCVVPSSSYNYSYSKNHRLAFSGSFTKILNIKWYTSGSVKTNWGLGTGGMLLVGVRDTGANGCPNGSYQQAAGTQGTTGNYLKHASTGHAYYKDQTSGVADADSYTSSSPLTIDLTEYTTTGYSNHVVTQVKLSSSATQGDKPNETFTWVYDEI
jgi:hypothetical protein